MGMEDIVISGRRRCQSFKFGHEGPSQEADPLLRFQPLGFPGPISPGSVSDFRQQQIYGLGYFEVCGFAIFMEMSIDRSGELLTWREVGDCSLFVLCLCILGPHGTNTLRNSQETCRQKWFTGPKSPLTYRVFLLWSTGQKPVFSLWPAGQKLVTYMGFEEACIFFVFYRLKTRNLQSF